VVRKVVDDDPASAGLVPGGTSAEYFSFRRASDYNPLTQEAIKWGATGRLLFTARIVGGLGRTALFRWRASDGNLIQVADSNMIREGLGLNQPNSVFISHFANFGVTDNGIVLFRTRYTQLGGNNASGNVVCTSNGITVTPIEEAVPDQAEGAFFTDYKPEITLSPAGYMLFQGAYAGGVGNRGVYLKVGSLPLVRVVDNRPSSALPGLPAGAQIGTTGQYYPAMAISTNNHIAVQTRITANNSTRDAVILWDFDVDKWTELSGTGANPATMLLSGISDGGAAVVLAGALPHIADRTQAVSMSANLPAELQGVDLQWGSAVGSINNLGHAVVPYRRVSGNTPGLGFWTADGMLILADAAAGIPVAGIVDILASSRPEDDLPGRSGLLNDADQAVFHVTLSDGTQAIYMGSAE